MGSGLEPLKPTFCQTVAYAACPSCGQARGCLMLELLLEVQEPPVPLVWQGVLPSTCPAACPD